MRRGLAVLVVLGSAVPALGQSQERPPEIIIDPNGPGTQVGDPSRVPLPPAGPGRDAFMAQFIRVVPNDNEATLGNHAISASEFYTRVNRPDLVARAEERTRQRIWLMAGSALVLAAGVTTGVVVAGNAQDVNDPSCFVNGNTSYNACVDRHQRTTNTGVVIIVSSFVVAAGLFTWGMFIPQMVTAPDETVRLAAEYNRALGQKYGAGTPPGKSFHILPQLAPGYAGLTAQLRF